MNLGLVERMQEGTISEDIVRLIHRAVPDTSKLSASKELFDTLLRYEYEADNTRDYDLYSMRSVDAVDDFLTACLTNKYGCKISRMDKNRCMDVVRKYLTDKGLRT